MANQNIYKPKVWNSLCDVCGFKKKSDELRKRWDGLMVCEADWEPRHPQDFLRARKETSNVLPWSRPEGEDVNVGPDYPGYIVDSYFTGFPSLSYFSELPE